MVAIRPTFTVFSDLLCVESVGGSEFAFRLISQSRTPECGQGLVVVIWDDCVASYTKGTCYDDGLQQRRQGGRKDIKASERMVWIGLLYSLWAWKSGQS